jgi:hypothetical protein
MCDCHRINNSLQADDRIERALNRLRMLGFVFQSEALPGEVLDEGIVDGFAGVIEEAICDIVSIRDWLDQAGQRAPDHRSVGTGGFTAQLDG